MRPRSTQPHQIGTHAVDRSGKAALGNHRQGLIIQRNVVQQFTGLLATQAQSCLCRFPLRAKPLRVSVKVQATADDFAALSRFSADQVMLLSENAICVTMIDMLNVEGVVLEPAGALSLTALDALGREALEGKTVVAVVSGGNFDFERLPDVKERAMRHAGLKKYFILRLAQRPGALRDFLNMLGPDDDIARFEYLKKSARNFGSILIGIETKAPENFTALTKAFDAAGMRYQDITENEILANLII